MNKTKQLNYLIKTNNDMLTTVSSHLPPSSQQAEEPPPFTPAIEYIEYLFNLQYISDGLARSCHQH